MTSLGRGQDAAQGSHSVDSSPQAVSTPRVRRPILNPASHDLQKYKISSNIESVCYYEDGKYRRCAVVLDVGFLLKFKDFQDAMFPTRVQGRDLAGFPDIEEVVKISEYTVHNQRTVAPQLQVAGIMGVTLGTLDQRTDRIVLGLLHLRPRRTNFDEIRWHFMNDKSDYFPSAIKILLVVEGQDSPRFSFDLEVLPSLEVNIKKRWWHVWTNGLQPGGGWSWRIENDYHPEMAKNFLAECQKASDEKRDSQFVGLRAAVNPYLKALGRE